MAVEGLRSKLRAAVESKADSVGAIAKRAGVSHSLVSSFLKGRKAPGKTSLAKLIEASGHTLVGLIGENPLSTVPALAGTIDALGAVSSHGDGVMGRFELVESSSDAELALSRGGFLIVEPSNEPVPDRWHIVLVDGTRALMRAYSVGGEIALRQLGQKKRFLFDPDEHRIEGVVTWEMHPGR